jgi:hypothetical protein
MTIAKMPNTNVEAKVKQSQPIKKGKAKVKEV